MFRVTHRQFETWGLIAEGLTNKAIAQRMNLSERTVESQVSALLSETRFKNRTHLAIFFLTRRDEIESSKPVRRGVTREQEVSALLQEGKSVDAIAQELSLSCGYVYSINLKQRKTPHGEGK